MSNLLQNLRHSLRRLRKNPGLTAIVLLTLALGIGANTAMFTVDYASMIAPLPYPNPDQLVVVWSSFRGARTSVSAGDFLDWRQLNTTFQVLNAATTVAYNISTADQPEFVQGWSCTPGLFRSRGVRFMLGRDFVGEEGQDGRDHVVTLSYRLWKRLGSDPNILGKSVRLDREPYTIVGVWAEDTPENRNLDVWLATPLVFKPAQINHDFRWILGDGRLKPGVTIQQAQADMSRVAALIAAAHPTTNQGWGVSVEPLKNDFFPKQRRLIFWLLLGAVGFVLLIACVNTANLLLARGMTAQREIAVRVAVGASRRAIFAQQLTESMLLALGGGLLGLGLGEAMLRATIALMPPNTLPSESDLRLNLPILAIMLTVTTVAGLLFGTIPAWYASRVSPGEILKEGGRAGTGAARNRLRRILVIGEFALTLPLLAGASLAIHSFWNLTRLDLGVRTDHLFTFGLKPPDSPAKNPDRIVADYRQILDNVKAVPGVSNAAGATNLPMEDFFGIPFSIAGKAALEPAQRPEAALRIITPEYFSTFGVRLTRGRAFTAQDTARGVKVAIVSEEFVNRFLQGTNPLQQRLNMEQLIPGVEKLGPTAEWQIVGVFHTIGATGVSRILPEIDIPFAQSPWPAMYFGVQTAGDPAAIAKAVAAAVHQVDPEIALAEQHTMSEIRNELLASDSFMAILFGSFSAIALLLASVGIYGVMAFSVTQRSHEIAVRMALGAGRARVLRLVIREGVLLAGIGLGLGSIGAYFVGHAMQGFLFGVHAIDYPAFSLAGGVLLFTAMLACLLPARRAASVEPMQALRTE